MPTTLLGRFDAGVARARPAALATAGLAGVGGSLASTVWPGILPVDGLSALFLLPASLCGAADRSPQSGLALVAVVVAVAAPNLGLLVLGFETAALLGGRSPLGAAPMLAAASLLGLDSFDIVRTHAPEGWRALVLPLLLLAGIVPRWRGGALALPICGVYVLARTLLDLGGSAPPAWWGPAILLAGVALAASSAWRAVVAPALAPEPWVQSGLGLGVASLGLVLAGRAADLPGSSALAGYTLTLSALAAGGVGALLALATRVVERSAGAASFDRLGGLARAMPLTSAALAIGVASAAAMPATAGFSVVWTFVQALLGLARAGGGVSWMTLVSSAGLVGLTLALGLAACVRALSVVCLGRPRTPRTAAAQDPRGAALAGLMAAAGVLTMLGLAPGLVLRLWRPTLLGIAGEAAPPGSALGLLVVCLTMAAAFVLRSRPAVSFARWEGGREPPPPWLPFGDPAEQWSAASFAARFRAPSRLRWHRPPSLAVAAAVFLAFLAASLALGPA